MSRARPSGQNRTSAVMQQRIEAHDSLDDFPTPSWATRALVEHVLKRFYSAEQLAGFAVREPCCNRGYMARPLAETFGRVIATDIFDYGWPGQQIVEDYLFPGSMVPAEFTIANPPFRLAEQFITTSFCTPGWLGTAMIVRQAFLESEGRYELLYRDNPPTVYAQFVERVIMTKGIVRDPAVKYFDEVAGKWKRPTSATAYCWLVWLRDVPPQPPIWIPPCRLKLERKGDYEGHDESAEEDRAAAVV